VYLKVHSTVIFMCTGHYSQAPATASPDIPSVDG